MSLYKLYASLKKEFLLLINDRIGLMLLFVMPLLLVGIITVIQDGAYKVVNENKIPMVVVNDDHGAQGEQLVHLLRESGLFEIDEPVGVTQASVREELLAGGKMLALYIPTGFTAGLQANADEVSQILLQDLGLDSDSLHRGDTALPTLQFFHDPVLQENYAQSVLGMLYTFMGEIENTLMVSKMYSAMDIAGKESRLKEKMKSTRVQIEPIVAMNGNSTVVPNATQHNVPAWTIFAMFFMVVSLGSNLVKERNNGSFMRLRTMPTSFALVMISKIVVYVGVAILQVLVTFGMGMYLLPMIDLPALALPDNIIAAGVVVLMSSLAAVSYALLIGSWAQTQEQANGFGAVSIIILGAIGGILVPIFVMPSYMQMAAKFSPLHWCLEGFYVLFLKGGSWQDLQSVVLYLGGFIVACQLGSFLKLKIDKII
ncbi:ABC-2 type transport system permease protein [Dyadobacter jejuensis]|uniref:ABC-2 type transport system permease protein n=1 Tax=Dyadobacter jejuensis TaxID=1082580 RepID=A0A316ALR4_9BACT|nr:ABC transporter permease [Dyadobacter jejuensis]PWJ58516.1 ABC-2 type transport system permease protein [Dyadobacter jejuensis]